MTTPISGLNSDGTLTTQAQIQAIQEQVAAQEATVASQIFGAGGAAGGNTSATGVPQNQTQQGAITQAINTDTTAAATNVASGIASNIDAVTSATTRPPSAAKAAVNVNNLI